MKYILITIAIVLATLLAWILWPKQSAPGSSPTSVSNGSSGGSTNSVSVTPAGSGTTGAAGPNDQSWVDIPTNDGQTLRVKAFFPADLTLEELRGGDYFLVGDDVSVDPAYRIAFYAPEQSFSVILLQEPLGQTRAAAEQDLLARLGIAQTDACRLRYFVSTPAEINPIYAGKNFGFSFCPGATPLP